MTKKEKSRLETGSTRKNTPNHQHTKNYNTFTKKSSRQEIPSFRLLPLQRIGQRVADHDPSAGEDSIRQLPGDKGHIGHRVPRGPVAHLARLPAFLWKLAWRTKAINRLPCCHS